MRAFLDWLWYIFVVLSYGLMVAVLAYGWSAKWYVVIAVIGYAFYYLRLYCFNNLLPWEINYRTVAYYLVDYCGLVLAGIAAWLLIRAAFLEFDEAYFRKLFPTDEIFYMLARRIAALGAFTSMPALLSLKSHTFFRSLYFTDKAPLGEVVSMFIPLLWLFFSVHMIGMLIAFTAIRTMPYHIKGAVSRISLFFNRGGPPLLPPLEVKNNLSDTHRVTDWDQYLVFIMSVPITLLIAAVKVQLPLALLVIGFGAVMVKLGIMSWSL